MNRRFALIRAHSLQRYQCLVACQCNYRSIGIGGSEIDKTCYWYFLLPYACAVQSLYSFRLVRWIFVAFKILLIETSRNGSYQFIESKSRICESRSGSSNKYFRSEGNSGRDENQFGSKGDDEDVSWTFLWPCGVDRRRANKPLYENIYICTGCIVKGFIMPKSYLLQAVQSLIIITPAWPYTGIIIGMVMPGIVQNLKNWMLRYCKI